jgi:hypothetical protein
VSAPRPSARRRCASCISFFALRPAASRAVMVLMLLLMRRDFARDHPLAIATARK